MTTFIYINYNVAKRGNCLYKRILIVKMSCDKVNAHEIHKH
jgi:hypothetical protein